MDIEAGQQVINVYQINTKGDSAEVIPENNNINVAAAYETGRSLIHYGYIVMIITEDKSNNDQLSDMNDSSNRYFIGADKLGLKFFKDLFGTNMDMYLISDTYSKKFKSKYTKPNTINKSNATKPEETKQDLYVKLKQANTILDDIKTSWGELNNINTEYKHNIRSIKEDYLGKYKGLRYQLFTNNAIGVYPVGNEDAIIVFYNGSDAINDIKKFNMINDISFNPSVFTNVKPLDKGNFK